MQYLQNTIARLKALIPTLEAAFTAAGITDRSSWEADGDNILAQLEAETEAVRREYTASQLPVQLPQQNTASAPVSTGEMDIVRIVTASEERGQAPGGDTHIPEEMVEVPPVPPPEPPSALAPAGLIVGPKAPSRRF